MLSPGRGLRRAGPEEMARHTGGIGWKVAAELQVGGVAHEVASRWEPGAGGRDVQIDGKAATQAGLGRLIRVLWLVPAMDRLWLEPAEGRRRFLDRITLSFHPEHGTAVLAYEKAMRERNRLLKDMVTDAAWYAALEAQMAEAGAEVALNRRAALARIMAAARGAFPVAELGLVSEGPEEAGALMEALAAGRRRDLAAGRTRVGPHRIDLAARYAAKGMAAADCSTGEQKALLISVILANARALAEDHGEAPVLLLDEVAAHLDAGRRAALYEEIGAMGVQAFLTGTGAELFGGMDARAQRFEVTEAAGVSVVRQVGA